MAKKKITPLLARAGGKRWAVNHIVPAIPSHTLYVEPFCGQLAVLLAKARSSMEVINDLDGELVNLFRIVKHHPAALQEELSLELNSREQFAAYHDEPRGLTDIQRAARYLMTVKNSFGSQGRGEGFGAARKAGGCAFSSIGNRIERIGELSARLDKTVVESLPYEEILAKYDCATTFFFCDPPYTEGKVNYGAWGDDDVARFAARVLALKGAWMVTLNDTPENRAAFRGCRFKKMARTNGIENRRGKSTKAAEILITPNR